MRYVCLLLLLTSIGLLAADPVARITSSGPLVLDGKVVPATAASSLPLVLGDEVATSTATATIFFADKSSARMKANSRVKLRPNGSSVVLQVLSGSAILNRTEGSQVTLIEPVQPAPTSMAARASAAQTTTTDKPSKPPKPSKKCPKDEDEDCD
jgi:hypothetical protein